MANPVITNLDGSNPGPAGISTINTQLIVGNQQFPNFGSGQGQASNMLRLLAGARNINISTTGDVAFLPFINVTNFSFGDAESSSAVGLVIATNPIVGSTGALGTAAALVMGLWATAGGTGTNLVASVTTTTLTGAAAATSQYVFTVNTPGYYTIGTTGNNPWGSNGVYVNVTTKAATATQMDLFLYGFDFS